MLHLQHTGIFKYPKYDTVFHPDSEQLCSTSPTRNGEGSCYLGLVPRSDSSQTGPICTPHPNCFKGTPIPFGRSAASFPLTASLTLYFNKLSFTFLVNSFYPPVSLVFVHNCPPTSPHLLKVPLPPSSSISLRTSLEKLPSLRETVESRAIHTGTQVCWQQLSCNHTKEKEGLRLLQRKLDPDSRQGVHEF